MTATPRVVLVVSAIGFLLIPATVLSFFEHVDPSVAQSVDNILRMIGFPLPIVALADILTLTAATLSLIPQLAEAFLMTFATLGVAPVIAASIQTLPIIIVALIALGIVESAEVAPMTVVPVTMAVSISHSFTLLSDRLVETLFMTAVTVLYTKTMLVRTESAPMITEPLWTLSIVEVATASETGLTVKSHEPIEGGSLPMIDVEPIQKTESAAGTVMA
ncbi:OLC1v1009269C2 [Oldenlandia corymbosa var. corymbosa]|nr:OLC1v1009269C2 [Oldenlandia corymbosa var. corymbosa]